ncbi:MAG: transketolase [Candidatus Bathyarchaeia archaeon]|nr:transketolase [Candidatus Bathyarchaeota archaeon]
MHSQSTIKSLEEKALTIRRGIIEIMANGKRGHLGGSLSIADIIAALYFHQMRIDPKNPNWEDRDRFVLSKGHSVLAQYVALAELGFFPREELKKVKKIGSILQGHPDRLKTPGIEASTGSLGQGLSVACGMALGAKIRGKDYRTYVIVGDGESTEGMIWEAAIFASHYKLDNLTGITDQNRLMASGSTIVGSLSPKWRAFGWETKEIDGHNMNEILDALDWALTVKNRPVMLVCNTIKGRGISFVENNVDFHHCALTNEQYEKALRELNEKGGKK